MKTAKVLRYISRELPPGTVMDERGEEYVKRGHERATIEHKVAPGCLPLAWMLGHRDGIVKTPNHVPAEQVDNMPEWFAVSESATTATETGAGGNN